MSETKLLDFLKTYADGKYAKSTVYYLPDEDAFSVSLDSSIDSPSERAKTTLRYKVEKLLGVTVHIRESPSDSQQSMYSPLSELIQKSLGENFADLTISAITKGKVDLLVLVNGLHVVTSEAQADINETAGEFLSLFELTLERVSFAEVSGNTPSLFQLIRVLYELAPATNGEIAKKLVQSNMQIPSVSWLNRQLDALQRDKILLWQKGGKYVLTEAGIAVIPKQLRRNSPDIQRALALARRKWVE